MAEVIHRYVGRGATVPERKPTESELERSKLDAKWKQARIDAERARQKVHAAKYLEMRGELISKKFVTKQAAFLVLSLRARLLALAGALAPRIARACGGGEQRTIESLIDDEVRGALDQIAEMPNRVVDAKWAEKLEEGV